MTKTKMTKTKTPIKSYRTGLLSLGVAFALAASSAHATMVGVSNLGLLSPTGKGLETQAANSFTTGSGPGWILDSIKLDLFKQEGAADFISVTLFSDNSGLPGSPLALNAVIPVISPGSAVYSLTGNGLITLAPSTTYWVVAFDGDTTSTTTAWSYAFPGLTSETGLTGWTIGDDHYQDFGPGWNASTPSPSPFLFSVDVTAVPEPGSTLALLGLGLAGLTGLRRRIRA